MYPHERSLVNDMKNRPFALIGINSDQDLEKARAAVKQEGLNWRSFQNRPVGAQGAIADAWAVRAWPTVIVLDEDLRIRHRSHDGKAAMARVEQLVKALEQKLARGK